MDKRQTLKEAKELAAYLGLEVYSYNPGDGSKYKVSAPGMDFFSVSRAFTLLSPAEVMAYLRGVQDGPSIIGGSNA